MIRFFVYSAAVLLLITGIAKLIGSAGHEKILLARDPVIGIRTRELILVTGLIELAVAAACFLSKGAQVPSKLIAWLSTNLLIYRIILILIDYKKPCNCLGNVTDALHIPPQTADTIMKIGLVSKICG